MPDLVYLFLLLTMDDRRSIPAIVYRLYVLRFTFYGRKYTTARRCFVGYNAGA